MEDSEKLYKEMIDDLVTITKDNIFSRAINAGYVRESDEKLLGINKVLEKLSVQERQLLANYAQDTYLAGVFDTLHRFEWLRLCKSLVMTTEAGALPIGAYEGLPNDYIGRYYNWEWPDETE